MVLYLEYLFTSLMVVLLSIKASDYVDLLDKKSNLSGAFLGGIMLSAVTSLPELFTSISSTLLVKKPDLCLGNILGSDLFNMAALAVVALVFFKKYKKGKISSSYRRVAAAVVVIYVAIALNFAGILKFEILTVSVTTLIIIVMYIIGAKFLAMASDNEADEEELNIQASKDSPLTIKQIGIRFAIVSIGIIAFSIIVTFLTDQIAVRLNLGAGFAGALFLGVATSLPELTSTITLFKMKNFNIAVGNIVGSNLFNFIILALVDIISLKENVVSTPDAQVMNLMICGIIAAPLLLISIKIKNNAVRIGCYVAIALSYVAFLVM